MSTDKPGQFTRTNSAAEESTEPPCNESDQTHQRPRRREDVMVRGQDLHRHLVRAGFQVGAQPGGDFVRLAFPD